VIRRDEAPTRRRLAAMPETTTAAILFPGQGAPLADAKALVEARSADLHARATELLGADPFDRAEASTRYAQPAIFLASLAGWQTALSAGIEPFAFAGHSLGELSALTAAGTFDPEDGLRLVALRGALMDELSRSAEGGMLAILKGTVEQAERLARAHDLAVANYNAPTQTVLSGSIGALEEAAREAKENGLRVLRLAVSGAFHTPALRPARARFEQAIADAEPKPPCAPVISSMTAQPFTDPVSELGAALIRPVRWSETMATLRMLGAPAYLDVGPDRVLERLVLRNLGEAVLIDRTRLHVHA
jgi:[acyl-carrier-protein] S-malonyltransferase